MKIIWGTNHRRIELMILLDKKRSSGGILSCIVIRLICIITILNRISSNCGVVYIGLLCSRLRIKRRLLLLILIVVRVWRRSSRVELVSCRINRASINRWNSGCHRGRGRRRRRCVWMISDVVSRALPVRPRRIWTHAWWVDNRGFGRCVRWWRTRRRRSHWW